MKTYTIGGEKYIFDRASFRHIVEKICKEKGVSKQDVFKSIAEELDRGYDTVKNWFYEVNGPGNNEILTKLAEYLGIDVSLLVRKTEGGEAVNRLNERQKDSAKRIYDILIWFLEEFNNTDGFNDWWAEFMDNKSKDPEGDILERANTMMNKVNLVIEQEYFDLHDHDVYEQFCEFASEDLYDMFDGKIGYAYRFESDGENSSTTWQDYEKARHHLNEIIDRYY